MIMSNRKDGSCVSDSQTQLALLLTQLNFHEGYLPDCSAVRWSATRSSGAVAPGVYRYRDQNGNSVYRVVDTKIADYDVVHVPSLFDVHNDTLVWRLHKCGQVFVVLDPAVKKLYGREIISYLQSHKVEHVVLELEEKTNNEENKSPEVWARLVASIVDYQVAKTDGLLAVGGGVVSDLAGFVAATVRRGIKLFVIPTTLTGMVDAAINPKRAINVCAKHKNAAGAIYPPEVVLYDPALLATCNLNCSAWRTGIAELIKLATVRSPELFAILEDFGVDLLHNRFQGEYGYRVIDWAIQLFLKMKWEEPFPGNEPASLRSFGHSFSRQLEGFSDLSQPHGDAVAVEMAVASMLSHQAGILRQDELYRILRLISGLSLPIYSRECDAERIWQAAFARRKHAFYFPVPSNTVGRGTFLDWFSQQSLAEAIERLRSIDLDSLQRCTSRVQYAKECDKRLCMRLVACRG